MTYHTLRVCANRGAFEAIPEGTTELDLAAVRGRLEAHGVSVLDCRVMLIAKMEREVTVGRDGRILIKTRDRDEAQRLLERLAPMVGVPL
ncbi:MAG: hypothetical protein L3J73_01180 [Thermoplasmata archaeon]|nr:hypothetical protein [Thermoplasmata archaeon]